MAHAALADLYVRHAMPLVDPARPSGEWRLSPTGRRAALDLARGLDLERPLDVVVSSIEPKALATAEPIAERFGADLVPDARLIEAERPWVGVPSDYRALVHEFLRGGQPDGWELRAAVVERIGAAVADARETARDGGLAVVGHGLSLCLHLEAVMPRGFDAGGLWSRLSFPDAWVLDRGDLLLSRCRPAGLED